MASLLPATTYITIMITTMKIIVLINMTIIITMVMIILITRFNKKIAFQLIVS